MPLEYWQAQGIKHLPRKPVPVFEHPLGKDIFPNIHCDLVSRKTNDNKTWKTYISVAPTHEGDSGEIIWWEILNSAW